MTVLITSGMGERSLVALQPNAELASTLTEQRWLVMRRARQVSASWKQIGAALDLSGQSAWTFVRRKLAEQRSSAQHSQAEGSPTNWLGHPESPTRSGGHDASNEGRTQ
jgi:hypothetical protein